MVNLFTLKEFGQTSNCMGFWGSLIYIALLTLSVVLIQFLVRRLQLQLKPHGTKFKLHL